MNNSLLRPDYWRQRSKHTIIRGGLVLDATGADAIPDGVVHIQGDRIVAVGPLQAFADLPQDATVIDAAGCTVIPGMIDGHCHVLAPAFRQSMDEGGAALWGVNAIQGCFAGGVTTVRDLGTQYRAIFALKKAVENGTIVGARVLTAGAAVAMTGGHAWDFKVSAEADGPDAVMRLAREQIKYGADVIKVMATGGAATAGEKTTSCQLTVEELRAAIGVAHDAGKPTTTHAHGTRGIRNSILAGIDCIEHGVYFDDETIELMLKHDVALSPTLSVYSRIIDGGKTGLTYPHMVEKAEEIVGPHAESFRNCLKAGVRIMLGTDAGSKYHPLGDVAYELELWVGHGMSNKAALEAATRVSARECHIDDRVGTLEAGKLADIVILGGNAIEDIGAVRDVRRVLRNGVTVFDATVEKSPGLVADPIHGPRP